MLAKKSNRGIFSKILTKAANLTTVTRDLQKETRNLSAAGEDDFDKSNKYSKEAKRQKRNPMFIARKMKRKADNAKRSLAKPQIQEARLTRINQSASAKIVNKIAHLWMLDSFLIRCFQFFSMKKKQWLKHLLRHDLAIVTNLTCSVYRCHQRAFRSLRYLVIRLRNLITRVLAFQNHVKLTERPTYGYYQFIN